MQHFILKVDTPSHIDPLHMMSLIKLIIATAMLEDKTTRKCLHARTAQVQVLESDLEMVNFCAIVGCSNHADKHKGVGFYRLPAIISHQGEQTYELSCKRRDLWLSRIHREDLGPNKYPYVRVCSWHFISGKLK